MKITKSYLKQIIKEEISKINESAEITRESNLKYILWTAKQMNMPPTTQVKDLVTPNNNLNWILNNYSKQTDPATIYPLSAESTIADVNQVVDKEFPGYRL